MKRIDLIKELRASSENELQRRLTRVEGELAHSLIKKSLKRLANAMQVVVYRKEVARIKTILAEKARAN